MVVWFLNFFYGLCMNTQNTQHLVTRYPGLYRNGMYFECGDGWFDLIDSLSHQIEKLLVGYGSVENEETMYAIQVKEKFGTLRFYMSAYTDQMEDLMDQIEDLIEDAQSLSAKTCEVCGQPGSLNGGPWYRCVCDVHNT